MLLVSYLIVGMSTLFDFTAQEHRAYEKLKKLTASDSARHKAANVIKTALRVSKNKKKNLHKRFVYKILLRQHLGLFRNSNKVAHSRMLPTDQMLKNLEEKLKKDLYEMRSQAYTVADYEQQCQQIQKTQTEKIT